MDPIITLIVSALALGAAAGARTTIENAIQDAYKGLKLVIVDHFRRRADLIDAMDNLDKKPQDADRRAALASVMNEAKVMTDAEVVEKAMVVHAAVTKYDPEIVTAIGMHIGDLQAAILEVENVQAGKQGVGVNINKADIQGTASFKNIGIDNSSPNQ